MKKNFSVNRMLSGIALVMVIAFLAFGGFSVYQISTGKWVNPFAAPIVENTQLGGQVGNNVNSCTGGNTQSLILTAVNKETNDEVITNFAYRRIGDSAWSSGTFGTALTNLVTGGNYEFVPGVTPSVETSMPYGLKFEIANLPCRDTKQVEVANNTLYTEMTATFYNADGTAAYQALSAGKTFKNCIKWFASNNEFAGNPYIGGYPNVVCVNLNSTSFDTPVKAYIGSSSVELPSVGTPKVHAAATGYTAYCYSAPVFNENEEKFCLEVDTDDTYVNTVDQTAYLYTGSYYIHSVNKGLMTGVETDDGNFVGFTAAEQGTLDYSA